MKKTTTMMYMTLIIGTLVTLSSENWLSMWMGLEMNMMAFIPLVNLNPMKSGSEASMIYFLIQSISSIIMLSMIIMYMMNMKLKVIMMILTMSILIKLGAAPFHMWMPKIMTTMSWNNNILFMTWQKVAPMYLLNLMEFNNTINISIILSVTIGALGGLYQTSLRKIMAYSSINHLGWMMSLTKMKNNWMIYLSIYSLLMITMCNYLTNKKLMFINQLFNINMTNLQKINFIIMMMSLGGMPPMLGFMPKWIVIEELMSNKSMIMMLVMIMMSMMTLFYYMRISFKMIMLNSLNNKWTLYKDKYMMMMFMVNMMVPMIMMIY